MEKTKIDFITDLLTSSKLKAFDKERILLLTANELKNDGLEFDKIWEEIELLKGNKLLKPKEAITNPKKQIEKKHYPRDVADFMSLFNQRDGLKYLTHDYDEEGHFDIEAFLKDAKLIFDQQTNGPLSIPQELHSIVLQFAFADMPKWGPYFVNNEGFSSTTWIQWSKDNKLHPIRNESFKVYIDKFRELTRIQAPKLESIIQGVLDKVLGEDISKYQIDKQKLEIADFYTNISPFIRALTAIIQEMKNSLNSRKITISYDRLIEGDYFLRRLILIHHDSFPVKELDLILKEWNQDKGAMGDIRNHLIGYCDWSVETKIEEKPIKINILRDKETPFYEIIAKEDILGFKHILTFYYK
jgi:hypothetical protein